jgi:hypothetical protein
MNENIFNSKGWDFCDENATEGISNGCVNSDEGERCLIWLILMKLDSEILRVMLESRE